MDFFWINRDQKSFEWFVSLLSQLEMEQAETGGALGRLDLVCKKNEEDLNAMFQVLRNAHVCHVRTSEDRHEVGVPAVGDGTQF